MIRGESIFVRHRVSVSIDAHNNEAPPAHGEPVKVDNVLIAPGSSADITGSIRPDGKVIRYTLYFPKSFTDDLTGALIDVREDKRLAVVGSPRPWNADTTPGNRNLVVEVVATDG